MRAFFFRARLAMSALALTGLIACGDGVTSSPDSGSLELRVVLGAAGAPMPNQSATNAVQYATVLRVFGPTTRTLQLTFDGSNYVGTIDNLSPGLYTVILEGVADGEVDHFGRTTDVEVTAGQQTPATVLFESFVPLVADFTEATTSVVVSVSYQAVPNADDYDIHWSADSMFVGAATVTTAATTTPITLDTPGDFYFRVRARNADVPNGRFSAAVAFSLQTDTVGNDIASAMDLGFGTAATATLNELNILPSGDEDWFAVGLCQGDTLGADVRAARLVPASPLNSTLSLYDAAEVLIDSNDDAVLTDSRLLTVLPSDGTFWLAVAGQGGSHGHYELLLDVMPGPLNTGSACSGG
jgi:hypothetical protein